MSNNNSNAGLAMGTAVVVSGLLILGGLIYAAALFLALIYTLFCIAAWNEPVIAFGETITPEEARAFVKRGMIGACLLTAFVLFTAVLFGLHVRPNLWVYVALGGYALGSIGIEYQIRKENAEQANRMIVLPSAPSAKPKSPMGVDRLTRPPAEPQPFRFASWDDEEKLRS